MGTKLDDLTDRVKAGRETVGDSFEEIGERLDMTQIAVAGIVAGVAIAALAVGIGMVVYRRRRRRTLAERLQGALPDSVWDLPGGIRGRLKRAL